MPYNTDPSPSLELHLSRFEWLTKVTPNVSYGTARQISCSVTPPAICMSEAQQRPSVLNTCGSSFYASSPYRLTRKCLSLLSQWLGSSAARMNFTQCYQSNHLHQDPQAWIHFHLHYLHAPVLLPRHLLKQSTGLGILRIVTTNRSTSSKSTIDPSRSP
jgi:hypothetical protein